MESKSDVIVDLKVKNKLHYTDRTHRGLRLSAAEALMLQIEAALPVQSEFEIVWPVSDADVNVVVELPSPPAAPDVEL